MIAAAETTAKPGLFCVLRDSELLWTTPGERERIWLAGDGFAVTGSNRKLRVVRGDRTLMSLVPLLQQPDMLDVGVSWGWTIREQLLIGPDSPRLTREDDPREAGQPWLEIDELMAAALRLPFVAPDRGRVVRQRPAPERVRVVLGRGRVL